MAASFFCRFFGEPRDDRHPNPIEKREGASQRAKEILAWASESPLKQKIRQGNKQKGKL
jgi:hypothetical protein